MLDWSKLFMMQKKLDTYIETNQDVEGKELFEEKMLALLVELGELANETRCFKFWSTKKKSADDVILAEYVDGLHFILSLGLDNRFYFEGKASEDTSHSITEQFNHLFATCIKFKQEPSQVNYEIIFTNFLLLGKKLGFNEDAVYNAYVKKNEINYERQDQGY